MPKPVSLEELFKQALAKHPDPLVVGGEWVPGSLPLAFLAERPPKDPRGDCDGPQNYEAAAGVAFPQTIPLDTRDFSSVSGLR